jgi:hypothetical protein
MMLPADSGARIETPHADLPILHDLRPKFSLFSWARRDGSRRFALMFNRNGSEEDRFIDRFSLQHTTGIDITTLEHEFSKLPRGCLVVWIRDGPHKLDYAEAPFRRRIMKLAARLHLDLQFNEMSYESTGVKHK